MLDGLNQSVRELLSRATGMWPPAGGRHAVKLGDDSKLYLVLACERWAQQSYEISATVEKTLDKIVASRHDAKPAAFERAVDVTVPADNQSALARAKIRQVERSGARGPGRAAWREVIYVVERST